MTDSVGIGLCNSVAQQGRLNCFNPHTHTSEIAVPAITQQIVQSVLILGTLPETDLSLLEALEG